jgi:saccharopine dehydrogenase (NAD+, L-lysine-forming)
MKVLLVGTGGVGEAISVIAKFQPWVERVVLTDYNLDRVHEVQAKLGDANRFPGEWVDANNQELIEKLAKKYEVDLIMNACDPSFNVPIFEAAYQCGCNYMDMAMTLSEPHPDDPYHQPGIKLGDYQFVRAHLWEKKGNLALLGLGVEPGMADVFARYAQDHLFDAIEECLNPPVIWEKERGWFTTEPFSEPETFEFPEGIGKIECVNVEHEEVLLVPRWIKCKRVTFKYALGDQFIGVLKTLHMLGLDNKEPIKVKDVMVAPRDVVAACLPDPAHLGDRMFGKTCAGTWVKGAKDGKPKQVYIYQVADNEECMKRLGCQAVVAQTAFNAVIGWDLIEHGVWKGSGIFGPEAFDPVPFMAKMVQYGFPYGIKEM